jgi:hypothetical protein
MKKSITLVKETYQVGNLHKRVRIKRLANGEVVGRIFSKNLETSYHEVETYFIGDVQTITMDRFNAITEAPVESPKLYSGMSASNHADYSERLDGQL